MGYSYKSYFSEIQETVISINENWLKCVICSPKNLNNFNNSYGEVLPVFSIKIVAET